MEMIAVEECVKAIEKVYYNHALIGGCVAILIILNLIVRLKNDKEEKTDYNKLSINLIDVIIEKQEYKLKELKRIKSEKLAKKLSGNT
ncbi:TPA: hypothetical protein I7126_16550 [Vibrio vulnificus]|nr:hypothetical protein [Vibrio vulnificus]HAS6115853.1 hypothetical protein [Vibrio vulnificus]HAS6125238.1 hypothetical protein [Vibrio vulnificus]